ncbi:hypothetical protein KOR42_43840 [Thalassoglobus neptunius]|uniref:Uncharacterized protein n=1 Tax=Thalassoglobus neptunius TaxID=1938619 RepID=A0A5C5W832_9PLAN|nr:hypothetical protein KOR42_43840 [Thalassoglobus neptunius]
MAGILSFKLELVPKFLKSICVRPFSRLSVLGRTRLFRGPPNLLVRFATNGRRKRCRQFIKFKYDYRNSRKFSTRDGNASRIECDITLIKCDIIPASRFESRT